MVLKQEANGWSVTIKTKSDKVRYTLSAVELQDAVMQAEQLYADVRTLNNGQPRCMDCIHWELIKANCNVGCPEGKLTGGSFAKDCAYFWPNP
jgi:hypothetical protein|tara:strand:- start:2843 stop:3121 length:279 start_codon:yes stop_codon:yes gene_type:complete